jgi:hypothetical protein
MFKQMDIIIEYLVILNSVRFIIDGKAGKNEHMKIQMGCSANISLKELLSQS